MRTTEGIAPTTGIYRAQSSGMSPRPIRRAASAGNALDRSSVAVNRMLIRSSCAIAFRSKSVSRSFAVAACRLAGSSAGTQIAPRAARTFTGIPPGRVERPWTDRDARLQGVAGPAPQAAFRARDEDAELEQFVGCKCAVLAGRKAA